MADKIILELATGVRTWLNPMQIIKMEQLPDGRYFVRLSNGEAYEIDRRTASKVEDAFQFED